MRFIRALAATSGGSRLNFCTALSGSGRASPMGEARTGPTSAICSGERSSFVASRRSIGEPARTGMRTWDSSIGTSPRSSDPPPVTRTCDTGRRPGSEAKYWIEFRISSTSSSIGAWAICSAAWIWVESSPNLYLMVSASTIGMSSEAEMAAVVALPPEPMVRTNWGRPFWWTTTTVSPAPMDTMASGWSELS